MERNPHSHKGENGAAAVIGGSRHQHGAPLFAALAAEASGVDLLHVCVPVWHTEVAKSTSLNFQVYGFDGDLHPRHVPAILEILATMDSAVVGPGIARGAESIQALRDIIAETQCPIVIDATALQPDILSVLTGKIAVLTPHLGELERMEISSKDLPSLAAQYGVTFLVKDVTDTIVSADESKEIMGGNAGLTVGGTGDALAGLTAGLLAQGMNAFDAAVLASSVIKAAGDSLKDDFGYAYGTRRVIHRIPHILA